VTDPDDYDMVTSAWPARGLVAAVAPRSHDRPGPWPRPVTRLRPGRFRVEAADGVPMVTTPEEIDVANAPELRSALVEAASCGGQTLVVDMTRTLFCDSCGLHTLLAAHRRMTAGGGELRLAMEAGIFRVFVLTGLDGVIPSFPGVEQALSASLPRPAHGATADKGTV
jgi:anti-sigma B factor antagonist